MWSHFLIIIYIYVRFDVVIFVTSAKCFVNTRESLEINIARILCINVTGTLRPSKYDVKEVNAAVC